MKPRKASSSQAPVKKHRGHWIWIICAVLAVALSGLLFWRYHQVNLSEFIQQSAKQKYNVLLITIDTLRADHLHCYGFPDNLTPNIDALAGTGVRFADATAHVPLTLPSHTSIHTGMFPSFHGVHDNGGFYVSKNQTTMAELFKKNGFSTAAFVGAFVLDSTWGIDQGFDTYFDNFNVKKQSNGDMGSIQRRGDEVLQHAVAWLDQHRNERFFLWTHFYDPHAPYDPPKEFAERYPGRPYAGEIAYTDSIVGQLFNYLDRHKLRENTIILLTADHGESLGEHKESSHAFFIYDATLHVPLILSAPQKELQNKVILSQARSVDIMPTLLQLAGISVPENVQGKSLLHYIFDTGAANAAIPSYAECYYPQFHFGWSRLLALRNGNYKYIDTSRPELYDLKKDPREENNIYNSQKQIADQMKTELKKIERVNSTDATMQPGDMDNETHEKLAALGYVGAFSGPMEADNSSLPDPKDKIDLFNLIGAAREDSLQNNTDLAISKFHKALQADPKIVDAHFMLGNIYLKQDRFDEALVEFKKTLELKPDYDSAIMNLANTYSKQGKLDEAIAGLEYFLKKNPEKTSVIVRVGELHLAKGEHDIAMDYFQRALKVDPDKSYVYNAIGVAYVQMKDDVKAEQSFRKALELKADTNMAHFHLGRLYETQKKFNEAEVEYLKELEVAPENFKAHFNLGRLYLESGREAQGIEQLKATVQNAPDFPLGYLFLAQAYVEENRELDEAMKLAEKGLSLKPDAEYKPLGHLVLADIYNRLGKHDLENEQLSLAKQ